MKQAIPAMSVQEGGSPRERSFDDFFGLVFIEQGLIAVQKDYRRKMSDYLAAFNAVFVTRQVEQECPFGLCTSYRIPAVIVIMRSMGIKISVGCEMHTDPKCWSSVYLYTRILELKEWALRAGLPRFAGRNSGRCGENISYSRAAKSAEVMECRSEENQQRSRPVPVCPQLWRSASPRFLGGVSSNGRVSMNFTNDLHSAAEKMFYMESMKAQGSQIGHKHRAR